MAAWEYQTIEVIDGMINQVNNKVINKTEGKFMSGATLYNLDEYLSLIGKEGWEVIAIGNRSLLYSPDNKGDDRRVNVLIAKRQIE